MCSGILVMVGTSLSPESRTEHHVAIFSLFASQQQHAAW